MGRTKQAANTGCRQHATLNLKNAVIYYENIESARKQGLMCFEPSPIWRAHTISHLLGFALFSAFRSQSTAEFRLNRSTEAEELLEKAPDTGLGRRLRRHWIGGGRLGGWLAATAGTRAGRAGLIAEF